MNTAIIVAAGKSRRMKGINKIFYEIKGKPLIFYTIRIFENHSKIKKIVLVIQKKYFKKFLGLIKRYKFKKVVKMVEGGKKRQNSAFNGLKAAGESGAKSGDLILFHNGANPLISGAEISKLIKAVKKYKAALLAQPAKDTVKKVSKDGFVLKTLPRENIYLAQTPQAIEYSLAKTAFEKSRKENYLGTDDVSLVERIGKKVKVIPCSYKNIKITTKDDLKIIKNFLKK